jgi:hypothetical protein
MMTSRFVAAVAAVGCLALSGFVRAVPAPAAGGTINGKIKLTGTIPGNSIIRMGMDPGCAAMNKGKRPVQETVAATADGSLGNVFVKLQGTFPQTPVPKNPVVIDQVACLFAPRVVGARVGQVLRVTNSDALLHNVHSQSTKGNVFNVGQPMAGMHTDFTLKAEEMLKIGCDVHRWMVSYVGIVNHPYFAVSDKAGAFTIADIPPGSYTVEAWHEQFGTLTQPVKVQAGTPASVTFSFDATAAGAKPK